jgi:cell filamentation protein
MEVLQNKLGITHPVELALAEERLSKRAALELYRNGTLDDLMPGTVSALAEIHRRLFDGLYEFAGEIRTVNLSKGGFRFASALYLRSALKAIELMPQEDFDQIGEKYVEMNVAHPFREGNGRSGRIWLDHVMRHELGLTVDWARVAREDYLLAMERSPVRDVEIKVLLKPTLSEAANDRDTFMKGIDASYAYEGYAAYRTEDL